MGVAPVKYRKPPHSWMTRWAKGATKFSVSVAPSVQTKTNLCHVPKPVLERLGNPPGLTFVFAEDGQIVVRAWDKVGRRSS